MDETKYLTGMPDNITEYGFCKVLAVRREVIHVKHIMTEVFHRKTIPIEKYLEKLEISLFDYMTYITHRLRRIHHFSRQYVQNPEAIVKQARDRFFPTLELLGGFNKIVVLDFDGVTTENNFKELYKLCVERENVYICSANPTVTKEWFIKRELPLPVEIFANKGKIRKIRKLIDLQKKHDYVFYVDNEIEYLEYAWLFGLQTYHWNGKEIKYFSLKTK